MKYKRIFLIILESLGIGATNDSDKYGDGASNTLEHALSSTKIEFPNLKSMGLFDLLDETNTKKLGYYTKASPSSDNKNTIMSHYEMMGNVVTGNKQKFNIEQMDKDLYNLITSEIDRKLIIAKKDSNTNIINNYGIEHIKTSNVIIEYDYYSIKLFAHESIIPLKELVKMGELILNILNEKNFIINKIEIFNFKGKPGQFQLLNNKVDLFTQKQYKSVLELLKEHGYKVITIGKASKIFTSHEMTNICRTNNDIDTIKKIIKSASFNFNGVCVANLSDLNTHGHNRDVDSYVKTLKGFDNSIALIVGSLKEDDLLIVTSDLGNDPTYTGNGHTREKVPVLIFNSALKGSGELPYLQSLCDIGATIADNFDLADEMYGTSFLERIK